MPLPSSSSRETAFGRSPTISAANLQLNNICLERGRGGEGGEEREGERGREEREGRRGREGKGEGGEKRGDEKVYQLKNQLPTCGMELSQGDGTNLVFHPLFFLKLIQNLQRFLHLILNRTSKLKNTTLFSHAPVNFSATLG